MYLVISLLFAFVVIRTVSIFIPSAYWSQVFSWVAWSAAALNAVGLLDVVIEWLRNTGVTIGPVAINGWAIAKGIILTAVLFLIGAIFIGFLMMPGSMYLQLVIGTGIGPAARWVTIILFAEIAKRSYTELKQQEIFLLY